MMLSMRLAVAPPSAMRLTVGLTMSEIETQMVGYKAGSRVIVMQMLDLHSQTLTVFVTQIYAKGMFAGMVYEILQEYCTSM